MPTGWGACVSPPRRTGRTWAVGRSHRYGEEYALGGTPQLNFNNQRQLEASDLWDFPTRELHSTQGRWLSPDPAGLAAVDIRDPQTWNRYSYVRNTPTGLTDPNGLDPQPGGGPCNPYGPGGSYEGSSSSCGAGPGDDLNAAYQQYASGMNALFWGNAALGFAYGQESPDLGSLSAQLSQLSGLNISLSTAYKNGDPYYTAAVGISTQIMSGLALGIAVGAPSGTGTTSGIAWSKVGSCLVSSTLNHYGLTAAAGISGALAFPIPKDLVAPYRVIGADTTNLLSVLGQYVEVNVPRIMVAGRASTNLFRVLGRANPYVAGALLAADIGMISYDTYRCYQR